MKFYIVFICFFVIGCAQSNKIKTKEAENKSVMDPLPETQKINFSQVYSYVQGQDLMFFSTRNLGAGNNFHNKISAMDANGKVFDLWQNTDQMVDLSLARMPKAEPQMALKDVLFFHPPDEIFQFSKISKDSPEVLVIELNTLNHPFMLHKLNDSIIGYADSQAESAKEGRSPFILSFNADQINLKFSSDIDGREYLKTKNSIYFYPDRKTVAHHIWRLKEGKPEPELIRLPWSEGVRIWGFNYDEISGYFLLAYQLNDGQEESLSGSVKFAKMDGSNITDIGQIKYTPEDEYVSSIYKGRRFHYHTLESTMVGDTYHNLGYISFIKDNDSPWHRETTLTMIKNGIPTILKGENRSERFISLLNLKEQAYAQTFESEKNLYRLYKLTRDGLMPLPDGKYLDLSLFNSQNDFYLRNGSKPEQIFWANKDTGTKQKIDLPADIHEIETIPHCGQEYLFTHDKKKQFTGMIKLGSEGKFEILDIPLTLKNVTCIKEENDRDLFLIAGQETDGGPWKTWKFSCQK